GMDPEGCGTPVAPHNGSIAASWSYEPNLGGNSGSLTLNGVGAYMGLAKVFNGGELSASADAPESITYMVTWNATEDTMTLDIAIADPGWWRFILVRADASGLNDNEYQVMEVYPNPASSVLNIKNHTDLESLHIYSVTGKMVLQTNDIDGTIDISDFATGLYAISALDKNGQKYQTKFIKN
ncbi:MAG: T9SS type A sorting domain-containing protein, partial [Bacteroidales bacterium]|nr:T9SS type A sorting domain-containing protein [Bacteroidales bacterium]